jgi:hypothetical protein
MLREGSTLPRNPRSLGAAAPARRLLFALVVYLPVLLAVMALDKLA